MVHSMEDSKDGGSRFLQSIGTNLQDYTALITRPLCIASPYCESL